MALSAWALLCEYIVIRTCNWRFRRIVLNRVHSDPFILYQNKMTHNCVQIYVDYDSMVISNVWINGLEPNFLQYTVNPVLEAALK